MKLEPVKLGLAGAVASAGAMLVLSLLNGLGLYKDAAMQMQKWHMYYTPDVGGTITGMIEAAIISFVALWVLAAVYNALLKK